MLSLKVDRLTVHYPGAIMKRIPTTSFDASEKMIVALAGFSGTGKSSILHSIAGFTPDENTYNSSNKHIYNFRWNSYHTGSVNVSLGNEHIPTTDVMRICLQKAILFEDSNFKNNILIGDLLPSLGVGMAEAQKEMRYQELKSHFFRPTEEQKINELDKKNILQLSGGQKQRVSLARALFKKRQCILLLDEPFSGIDNFLVQDNLIPEIKKFVHETNSICLFTSHSNGEIRRLADRVLWVPEWSNEIAERETVYYKSVEQYTNHHVRLAQ